MFMILFVLHDSYRLKDVLNAWQDTGVSGITILPSTGMKRLQENFIFRDDMPLIPSLDDLLEHEETLNRTLFTIVPSEEMVDKIIAATEEILGDLNQPNTGILSVIPISRAYGLNRVD